MDELTLEGLLSDALRPVEPPQRMSDRLHETFSAISEAAASGSGSNASKSWSSGAESSCSTRSVICSTGIAGTRSWSCDNAST